MLEKHLNLCEGSKNYYEENNIYELFSRYEDYPNKISNYLRPIITGKTVLDVGCGTGKYACEFYSDCQKYYGLDVSEQQLQVAIHKTGQDEKITYFHCSAEQIPLPNHSVDTVISTWVLGTILEIDRRNTVLSEMKRVLKKNGHIYLVENGVGGEFEIIRGRFPEKERTEEYNNWVIEKNFVLDNQIETFFKFKSKEQAIEVFSNIWGNGVIDKINSNIINHNVIVYKYKKEDCNDQ